jgi:site-specific DNA-methyltransferase (adenine-specific)
VTAIEDAGFEIRDVITHLFGTGFPKSLNVGKEIDKAASVSNDAARPWAGFGIALKPASEHWILARKPVKGTIAKNVLEYGTGALNIDGCRVGTGTGEISLKEYPDIRGDNYQQGKQSYKDRPKIVLETKSQGRWPANLILSHSPECVEEGERAEDITTPVFKCAPGCPAAELDEQSGKCVSRFFYAAKASKRERNEGLEDMPAREYTTSQPYGKGDKARKASGKKGNQNDHPTIKSIALMRYLCRLITPPGGTVLDPFMGSGTTGIAARQEGFGFIGIEEDAHYFEISEKRIDQ